MRAFCHILSFYHLICALGQNYKNKQIIMCEDNNSIRLFIKWQIYQCTLYLHYKSLNLDK